ncbi:polymorphic toxin-type HINT domain-containing protein [Streptomyces sp. NPDC057197]|uniref:polymorphic toxin-type HINT domain-containing protein n=1 Tax=Streptomyces sp. NPDC057197 TaxID=3346045 RepID=UPI00362DB91C
MRTGGKLFFLLSDQHGTATTEVTADAAQEVTHRKTNIFGGPRGTQPPKWAGDKGFVGGTNDADTGLVHLGAREYDPSTGRFISVDPLMDLNDPQQINGYTYGDNNPVSLSDPAGTRPEGICGGNTSRCEPDNSPSHEEKDYHESWQKTRSGWLWQSYDESKNGKRWYRSACVGCNWEYGSPAHTKWTDVVGAVAIVNPELTPLTNTILAYNSARQGNYREALSQLVDANGALKMFRGFLGGGKTQGSLSCITGRNSFKPDTPVLLKNGRAKKISDVKAGDEVEAADPETGRHEAARTVTAKHVHHDADLVDLTVQDPLGRKSTLHTTAHHPFWDDTKKKWVDTADLAVGDNLNTVDARHVKVAAVRHVKGAADMYNLTVANLHTYYVLAGSTPVLVHNTNSPIGCGVNGEPIYDIPAGSSGGAGAGKRIPPNLLKDYDVGKNAAPGTTAPLCSYCRTNPATAIDHVEPRIGGGDLTDANTTPACTFCNSSKRDRLAPLNPPPNYTGSWPPPWWPSRMTPP